MMQPADRDLHWHPLAATERERLFDQVDAFLADKPRVRPNEPVGATHACPHCNNPTLYQHFRYGPGGTICCPNCGWEEAPS